MRIINKRICAVLVFCLIIIGGFVIYNSSGREHQDGKETEYLIDVVIDVSEESVDYVELGIVLDNNQEKIINKVLGNDKKEIHFVINYSSDTVFFLRGLTGQTEIEKYYFRLDEYKEIHQAQEVNLYLKNHVISGLE